MPQTKLTDFKVLQDENKELKKALKKLINLYIANQNTDSEFICCITPDSWYNMNHNVRKRKKCKYWRAWDKARKLLNILKIDLSKSK